MAKVPYDKAEVLRRFDEFGAVTWMDGKTYTNQRSAPDGHDVENLNETNNREALVLALDAADPAVFEPISEVPTMQAVDAQNEHIDTLRAMLDEVKELHQKNLEIVSNTASQSVAEANKEAENAKAELAKLRTENGKMKADAKKSAKPADAQTAINPAAGVPQIPVTGQVNG